MELSRCDPKQQERIRAQLDVVLKRLDAYYSAEDAILSGAQEYRIGTRFLKRGDLQYVQNEIRQLQKRRDELEAALATCTSSTKRKSYRVLFRDF
ncbi:hypothetical protein ET33_26475 [Paenibacillus tyrfis]|uniref:Uncharacterized protein n=1 Tax=Paenibacillus tyrfis TaxID=1501230 RepID=A0A081NV45_9BACL|nr:hypothetical protein ET33_26475 [Paenibacillus tyrfis]